jgi:hypothetical protein
MNCKKNDYKKTGEKYWFEYHCLESEQSCHADLWHRTHQQVKILELVEKGYGCTQKQRLDNGQPAVYKIEFNDGFKYDAFEDELLKTKKQ